jgi:hypothetical protein
MRWSHQQNDPVRCASRPALPTLLKEQHNQKSYHHMLNGLWIQSGLLKS